MTSTTNNQRPVISIPPEGVVMVPWQDQHLVVYLPILPAGTMTQGGGYRDFLLGFSRYEVAPLPEQTELAWVRIEHQALFLTFPALKTFTTAMQLAHSVILVPYCMMEGIPHAELRGAQFWQKHQTPTQDAAPAVADVKALFEEVLSEESGAELTLGDDDINYLDLDT